MELLKEEKGNKIYKKRSGKYAVCGKDGKFINGQAKVDVLNAAGVIKVNPAKAKAAPAEEPAAPKATEEPKTAEE